MDILTDPDHIIKVDQQGYPVFVTGIRTKGVPEESSWIKSYKLYYRRGGEDWIEYGWILRGNDDADGIVFNKLQRFVATHIKIKPISYEKKPIFIY